MKKNLRSIIVVIICAALCIGYYYYLSHRDDGKEKEMTEVEMVISKNLDSSYPKTARETVKFYNRIVNCYYNEEYGDEQLEQLTGQAEKIMDEELRKQNPAEEYLNAVRQEVLKYKEEGKEITNISVERANDIEYQDVDGRECAYVDVTYFVKEEEGASRTTQTYILRKDDEGKWRLLGFYM